MREYKIIRKFLNKDFENTLNQYGKDGYRIISCNIVNSFAIVILERDVQ